MEFVGMLRRLYYDMKYDTAMLLEYRTDRVPAITVEGERCI